MAVILINCPYKMRDYKKYHVWNHRRRGKGGVSAARAGKEERVSTVSAGKEGVILQITDGYRQGCECDVPF